MSKHSFNIEVNYSSAHKPVVEAELESAIERAAYDAVESLIEPEELDVSVEAE